MDHRVQSQSRANVLTRKELLGVVVEEAREEYLVRIGQQLERTMDQLRWNIKRVSNCECDQTVTSIRQINVAAFRREMTIADRFESEWRPIMVEVHHTTPTERMISAFDDFVQIPASRCVSPANNERLLMDISLDEVVQDVNALNRHKTAGADGLNDDFLSTPRLSWSLLWSPSSTICYTVAGHPSLFWKDLSSHCVNVVIRQTRWIIDL